MREESTSDLGCICTSYFSSNALLINMISTAIDMNKLWKTYNHSHSTSAEQQTVTDRFNWKLARFIAKQWSLHLVFVPSLYSVCLLSSPLCCNNFSFLLLLGSHLISTPCILNRWRRRRGRRRGWKRIEERSIVIMITFALSCVRFWSSSLLCLFLLFGFLYLFLHFTTAYGLCLLCDCFILLLYGTWCWSINQSIFTSNIGKMLTILPVIIRQTRESCTELLFCIFDTWTGIQIWMPTLLTSSTTEWQNIKSEDSTERKQITKTQMENEKEERLNWSLLRWRVNQIILSWFCVVCILLLLLLSVSLICSYVLIYVWYNWCSLDSNNWRT